MTDVDLRAVHLSPTAPEEGNIDVTGTVTSGGVVLGAGGGGGGGGAGSDTTAAHRNAGHEAGSINVDGATVGTVSTPITKATAGVLHGSVTVSGDPDLLGTPPLIGGRYWVVPTIEGTACDVVDLADISAPVVVATLHPHAGTSLYLCAALVGTHTLVLSLDDSAGDGGPILEVWDLTTPSSPVYVTTATGLTAHQCEALCPVATRTGLLVAGTSTNVTPPGSDYQVLVWDVSVPASPVLRGTLDLAPFSSGSYYPSGLCLVDDTTVCLVAQDGSVALVDISTPTAPALLSRVVPSGVHLLRVPCLVTATDGLYVAVVQASVGLLVLSLANRAAPALVATVATATPSGLAVRGTTAYLAESTGMTIQTLDLSLPASPVAVGTVALGAGTGPTSVGLLGASTLVVHQNSPSSTERVVTPASSVRYPAQLAGAGITEGKVSGSWQVGGPLTAHGNPVPEAGAITAETITPDKTVILTINGVDYKVPAVLA